MEKIKGEFLKINKEGYDFIVEYADENKSICRFRMESIYLNAEVAKGAEAELERFRHALLQTKEKGEVLFINSMIEFNQIHALWPYIYAAYCKGEDLGQFFESQNRIISSQAAIKESLLERCRIECEKRKLPKGRTITIDEKYSIAEAIGLNGLPNKNKFKSRNPTYHRITRMLSELGYSRKVAAKY